MSLRRFYSNQFEDDRDSRRRTSSWSCTSRTTTRGWENLPPNILPRAGEFRHLTVIPRARVYRNADSPAEKPRHASSTSPNWTPILLPLLTRLR